MPTLPGPPSSAATGFRFSHQPPGYPNAFVWLRTGIVRDWRGALGAFFATWFYVPLALLVGFWAAVVFGIVGLFVGGLSAADQLPPELMDTPLIGSLLDAFLSRSAGVFGGLLGAVGGFLGGFLYVVLLPWLTVDSPVTLVSGLAGTVVAAIVIGLAYTLYRVLLEPRLLLISGARALSARERAVLEPVLWECARRLGLSAVPRLLIEDDLVLTNARTYTRHIVVTTNLLTEPVEEIEALLGHELVHWRTGDEITSAFVRGVALPLYLVHALPVWLMRSFPHPATNFLVFLVFWPVLLTMKYLVVPLHARDVRAAEYRADLGAVHLGRTAALRTILERRKSFENGRSGWDEVVCASHPVHEQRLDRLAALPTGTDAPSAGTPFGDGMVGVPPGPTRRTLVVALVVLLAGCLVSSGLGVVQWAFFGPRSAVHGYFSALRKHDAGAALDWPDPAVGAELGQDDTLAAMVAADDYEPPTDVDVTSMDRDGDEAVATISYTLAGAPMSAQLRLRRDESTSFGFRGWHLLDGLTGLSGPAQPGLRINGVELPQPEDGVLRLPVFPGRYLATLPSSALSETPPVPVVVGVGTEPGELLVTPVPRPDLQDRADQVVKAYLDECVRRGLPEATDCPFRLYGTTAERVEWTITKPPTVRVELVDATSASVHTAADGTGRVTAAWTADSIFGQPQRYTSEDDFSVDGLLVVEGDQVVFRPEAD